MEKLGDTLVNHFDGIAAYCNHPVRFGVVELLNTTIKGVLRRARGIGDEAMLLLKLKWASATPIRSSRDSHNSFSRFEAFRDAHSAAEPQPKHFGELSAISTQLSALDHKCAADTLLQSAK